MNDFELSTLRVTVRVQLDRIDQTIEFLKHNIHFETHGDCYTCNILQTAVEILEGKRSTRVYLDRDQKFQFEPNLPPMTCRQYINWVHGELEKEEKDGLNGTKD